MRDPYAPPEAIIGGYEHDRRLPDRPTSTIVFGILNLVFGSLLAIAKLIGMSATIRGKPPAPGENPIFDVLNGNPIVRGWTEINGALGYLLCALLIVGGIGLLMMRSWGRIVSLAYASIALIGTGVGFLIFAMFIFGPMQTIGNNPPDPQMRALALGMIVGMVGAYIGAAIYPTVITIFLMRPGTAQAFRNWEKTHAPDDFAD